MQTMTIARRFRGPPNSGNGGYVCGMLARHIDGAAEVTLRAPPPLETALAVTAKGDGTWELLDGATAVAVGRSVSLDLARLEKASFDEAAAAEQNPVVKPHEHLLPMCFVCGPERGPGDGLRIGAGPLKQQPAGRSPVMAATWMPSPNLGSDGVVAPEFLWAALDCPTGYAVSYDAKTGGFDRSPILLGRMTARIEARPRLGERCVITAWEAGREGRKLIGEAAVFGEAGTLLALARATWIVVDRQVQLGRG